MPTGVIVTLSVVGGLAAVLVGVVVLVRWMRGMIRTLTARRIAEADAILAGEEIRFRDDFANCFGVESLGVTQVRGNGVLTVTAERVHFLMLVPRREFVIPAAAITAIERVRGHLGKTVGRQLLKVAFTDPAGRADSAAWFTMRLDEAEAAVQALQRQANR